MLNKKAIAALAAGATLVSGLAFATPSFAADPQAPKKEECKPADAAKISELKAAVTEAKRKAAKAERTLADEKDKYEEDTEAYNTAKGLVDAFKQAVKNYKDAKTAADAAKDDAENKGALTDAVKKAAKAVNKAAEDAKKNDKFKNVTYTPMKDDGTVAAKDVVDTTFDATLGSAPTKHKIFEAEISLREANANLQDAQEKLAKAQCTPAPKPGPQPGPKPSTTPLNISTDGISPADQAQAIDLVRVADMNLQNATNNKALKEKAYKEAAAGLKAAEAEYAARGAALKAAEMALADFMASGANDSATQTRLQDALDRAQAHFDRAQAALLAAQAKFAAALKDANDAVAVYNHALTEYKRLYNDAVRLGVNPALLPPVKTDDPLAPNFPDITSAKVLYAEALSGKFGKAAQAVAKKAQKGEAKKEAGKKGASAAAPAGAKLDTKAAAAASAAPLSKTGVTVMFTALAASMLAGIGAAVRKFRH